MFYMKPRPLQIRPGNAYDSKPLTWKDIVISIIGLLVLGGIAFMVAVVMFKAFQ